MGFHKSFFKTWFSGDIRGTSSIIVYSREKWLNIQLFSMTVGLLLFDFFFLYRINFIDITWQTWHMYKLNKHIFKHWKKELAFWDQTLHFNSVLCLGVFFPWTVCQAVVLPRTANAILQMIYDFHVVSLNTFIWISTVVMRGVVTCQMKYDWKVDSSVKTWSSMIQQRDHPDRHHGCQACSLYTR